MPCFKCAHGGSHVRLAAAGVPVEVATVPGLLHGFLNLPKLYPQSLVAHKRIAAFVATFHSA